MKTEINSYFIPYSTADTEFIKITFVLLVLFNITSILLLFCFYLFQVYIINFIIILLKTFHSVNPFMSLNICVNFRDLNC